MYLWQVSLPHVHISGRGPYPSPYTSGITRLWLHAGPELAEGLLWSATAYHKN